MTTSTSNSIAFLSGNNNGTQFAALKEPTYLLIQDGNSVLHINGVNHKSTSHVDDCVAFESYSVFINSKEAKGPTGTFISWYANVYAASNTIPADIFAQMSEA